MSKLYLNSNMSRIQGEVFKLQVQPQIRHLAETAATRFTYFFKQISPLHNLTYIKK